jgi:hypothetical protein
MTTKLLGVDDASGEGDHGQDYLVLLRFQALTNGNMTEFKLKGGTIGCNAKIGLYSDNSGEPDTLITGMNTGQQVSAGTFSTLSFTSTYLTAGTYYWLAFICNANGVRYTGSGSATRRYKAYTYSSFGFPSSLSGLSSDTYGAVIAGWGNSILILSLSSISQPVSYGSPKLSLTIKPSSILQALAYGIPVVLTSAKTIQPLSIVQLIVIGTPSLRYPQIISPTSIVLPVAIGTPWVGIFGFIKTQSTVQQISIGSPTILKYVWHVILDGQYVTETTGVNRAYIIGRDQYGNPVYGTAVDSTELDLVGERLDFQQELAIPTDSQAESMASAVLSKMRLNKARGVILIPTNCGQELFDTVQISDLGANQYTVKLRVVGIRFEYNQKQARFEHRLILGLP